jgi:hypothetical protein
MTSNTRRPGFRLWGGDPADEPDESATEKGTPEEGKAEQPASGGTATPSAEVPAPGGATAEPPAPEPPAPEPSPESAGFLASLVTAMRSVAEEARDASLADFRASVETRIGEQEASAAERADDLRRQADVDIAGIGDWERSEMERVKNEAQQRTEARRKQLDKQLKDHEAASEQQVATLRGRLAAHEEELAAFFSQLTEIHDPGAFVAAAKRMPRPPQISGGTSAEPAAPRQTLDMRLAALGVERADAAPETEAPPAAATETETTPPAVEAPASEAPAPEAPAAETAPTEAATTEVTRTEPATEVATTEATQAEAAPAEAPEGAPEIEAPAAESKSSDATRNAQLADRLAELDTQLAKAPEAEPAPSNGGAVPDTSDEMSTAIVVKGLGSFGAITSFKQALERVDGVLGVTLSLGPTGEFVYRASHGVDFDLAAAVRSIEGPTAEIEQSEGTLRVSVSRNR